MTGNARTIKMTEGNPLRLILAFAVPLFVGNVIQQIYTLVDTMIVGYYLGDSAIAAIGATASIYTLMMNFAWGMNSGYTIVVTQEFGAGNQERFKKSVAAMFFLNLAGAAILTVIVLWNLRTFMRFINTPDSIFEQAYAYIAVICGGMGATLMYNMLAGFLRAMGNSRTPLFFLLVSSVLNLALDFLFVIGLKLGEGGAAGATVISQLMSAILCALYIMKKYKEYLPGKEHFGVEAELYKTMLSSGLAMAMMQCIFCIGSVILQRAVNTLGDMLIAANTAAGRIIGIFMMPLSTISTATSTFVGQNWGAGKIDRIKICMKQAMCLEVIWAVFSAVVCWIFGTAMIKGLTGTDDTELIQKAVLKMRIAFRFYPPLGILICLRMSMQSMGQKIAPLFSSSLELGIKVVAALWVIPSSGYIAVCYAEPLTWLACAVLLVVLYFVTYKKNIARRMKQIEAKI